MKFHPHSKFYRIMCCSLEGESVVFMLVDDYLEGIAPQNPLA